MKSKCITALVVLILSLSAATVALADIKMKTRNTVAGHTSEGTIYIKGTRQRSSQSFGGGVEMVTLTQCDLKRTVQVNDNGKTYMVISTTSESSPGTTSVERPAAPQSQPTTTRRGGVVTYNSTITDTGERKKMFGFTARHLKTSMTTESSPDACNPSHMRMETDGWYIDLEFSFNCDSDKPVVHSAPQRARPECQDEVRFKRSGTAKPGYPVFVTTTIYLDGGQTSTSTTEVVELTATPLDSSLFEVPAGYTEAKSYQELMGIPSVGSIASGAVRPSPQPHSSGAPSAAGSKRPGMIRVGVVSIANKTDRSPSLYSVRSRLISSIMDSDVDAVALDSRTPAEIEAEAKQKDCDYVLYSDLTLLKTSGKVGGLLGRATGVGGLKEKVESRLDFRLFPIGSQTARLTSSASAKDEGSEEASLSMAAGQEGRAVSVELRKKR
ncbi:MAG TPA: hypothetical protein VNS63_00015 [Blastocatellia bacterium]|nr:hypothetical protein [Blastocatellia bacterium]